MMIAILIGVGLVAALLVQGVFPGYLGSLNIEIDGGSEVELGVRQMNIRESIDLHSTSSTASPVTAIHSILQETRINGQARLRASIQAQYGAQGDGDPPDFSGEALYGSQYITADVGYILTGYFLVDDFGNSLNVDATIDYDLGMLSNGSYTRSLG